MATQRRNGNINGRPAAHGPVFDPRRALGHAEEVVASANGIALIADEVSTGAEEQTRTLDSAVDGLKTIATSLTETAGGGGAGGGAAGGTGPGVKRHAPAPAAGGAGGP